MLRVRRAWRGGHENRPGWWIEVHLDADWKFDIEALKRTVPPEERTWDEAEKRWWVSDAYAEAAGDVIHGLGVFIAQPAMPGF